jgi:hypothetical protein
MDWLTKTPFLFKKERGFLLSINRAQGVFIPIHINSVSSHHEGGSNDKPYLWKIRFEREFQRCNC